MKRKIMMVGFAMLTGLPHSICAKGFGKEEKLQAYPAWNTPYAPHYDSEGEAHPLMNHLTAPVARNTANNWRLELAPPRADSAGTDNPLLGRDKRVGISLKLDF
jgi:hypothetical protein